MATKRILLAEDDKDDQSFFFDFLKQRTDIIILEPVAENGIEVLEMLNSAQEQLPDIIILDQNMPMQNGLQTLQEIKSIDKLKHIAVFVYSTYANESLVDQSVRSGALGVLNKPSDFGGYNKMMDEILDLTK